jgi:hypothetical protein
MEKLAEGMVRVTVEFSQGPLLILVQVDETNKIIQANIENNYSKNIKSSLLQKISN